MDKREMFRYLGGRGLMSKENGVFKGFPRRKMSVYVTDVLLSGRKTQNFNKKIRKLYKR